MLKKIWIVLKYELQRGFWRRSYLFTTFGIPLLALVALMGYQVIQDFRSDSNSTNDEVKSFEDFDEVGYVDPLGIFAPPTEAPFVGKVFRYENEDDAKNALKDATIKSYYLINDDYLETGSVDLVTENFSFNLMGEEDLFKSFVLNSLLQNDPETAQLYIRLQAPSNIHINRLEEDGTSSSSSEDSELVVAYIFALSLLLSTITSSGYLMQSVVEERETRMIEILISSIRPTPLLTGKILAMGLLGLTQVLLWIGAASFILWRLSQDMIDLDLSVRAGTIVISLAYFVVGYLFLGAGFAAVGSLSNNMREGPQLATFISLPAVSPMWFMTLIVNDPNGTLATVLGIIPITAPLTMVIRAAVTTIPAWQVAVSMSLLVLATMGMMWMAGRLFRIGSLLAGTSPKLRDIPKLLRG